MNEPRHMRQVGPIRGPICCLDGCQQRTVVHLFGGLIDQLVSEEADYSGGSFCSWGHLMTWLHENIGTDLLGVPWTKDAHV